jgi:hypothetical protein
MVKKINKFKNKNLTGKACGIALKIKIRKNFLLILYFKNTYTLYFPKNFKKTGFFYFIYCFMLKYKNKNSFFSF